MLHFYHTFPLAIVCDSIYFSITLAIKMPRQEIQAHIVFKENYKS